MRPRTIISLVASVALGACATTQKQAAPTGGIVASDLRVEPDANDGSVHGHLDERALRTVRQEHSFDVRQCYITYLQSAPQAAGRLVVEVVVADTGKVLTAVVKESTLGAPSLDRCIVTAVREWTYPRPRGGGVVIVSYPFDLNPFAPSPQ